MVCEGHDWQNDEVITADLLNAMEDGIPKGEKGDTGAAGTAGLGVKTITLTTDSTGKVTSGKWTDTTDGQHEIIVSTAGA